MQRRTFEIYFHHHGRGSCSRTFFSQSTLFPSRPDFETPPAAGDLDEIIALEAKSDSESFTFWLAKVVGVIFTHFEATTRKDDTGFRLVQGCCYINVRLLDRFPPSSPNSFRLDRDEEARYVDAEAVVARRVQIKPTGRRTRGSAWQKANPSHLMILETDEVTRVENAARESLVALSSTVTSSSSSSKKRSSKKPRKASRKRKN